MTSVEVRNLIFASLISADNDSYSEEAKQEVIHRYKQPGKRHWEYILEPLGDEKYVELLKYLDDEID